MLEMLSLLLICQLAGEFISLSLGLDLPGPVLGMVILFLGLLIYNKLPEDLLKVSQGLLDQLSLLFVPAGVGVMTHLGLLGKQWLPLTVSLVLSTILTLLVTGWIMQAVSRKNGEKSIR